MVWEEGEGLLMRKAYLFESGLPKVTGGTGQDARAKGRRRGGAEWGGYTHDNARHCDSSLGSHPCNHAETGEWGVDVYQHDKSCRILNDH